MPAKLRIDGSQPASGDELTAAEQECTKMLWFLCIWGGGARRADTGLWSRKMIAVPRVGAQGQRLVSRRVLLGCLVAAVSLVGLYVFLVDDSVPAYTRKQCN
jgi:hypothetical protein